MTFWDTFWKEATENDKRDFLISLVVIVLAGVFILYYVMPNNESEHLASSEQLHTPAESLSNSDTLIVEGTVYEKVEMDETPIVVATNTGNSNPKDRIVEEDNSAVVSDTLTEQLNIIEEKDPINSTVEPIESVESVEPIESVEPAESIETDEPLEENVSSQNNLMDSNFTDTVLNEDAIREYSTLDSTLVIPEENALIEEEPELNENTQEDDEVKDEVATKKTPTTKINKDCVILVGAYTEVKNATKMRQMLEKAGFNVFVTSNKKFTNIGVYSSCESNLLNKNLRNIRTNFAKDAVLLKKK